MSPSVSASLRVPPTMSERSELAETFRLELAAAERQLAIITTS